MGSGSRQRFDVLVIGGGPAGLASAACAAECGVRVAIVDDNFSLGGQIWRRATAGPIPEAVRWTERLRAAKVTELSGLRVFHQPQVGVLLAEGVADIHELRYDKLIVATGARERFLPFPGWTLPNVMGAGGLQAMVKSGLPIHRKRVVVAGTGPLLLAVAAYLREHGAEILMISEQASQSSLARFGVALLRQPGKMVQGLRLKRALAGVPFATNSWPVAAQGEQVLESVTISRGGKSETVACDYLACGFHLVPNTELPSLLGCQIENGYVRVDDFQRTTLPEVFCAGEPTGIGGIELALFEGQIAGLASGGRADEARSLFGERKKLRAFAQALDKAFQLRAELQRLASPETIVCRCEDVPYSRLSQCASWRAAKLQTRCGMGPCQGRVCGPATQFLFKWNPDSVRPPIFPVRMESLAVTAGAAEPVHQGVTGGHG
jgi:NADPH-dependent 2,4-dienoyl-CoA reductase/sulfur reductase-like enzyme